MLSTDIIKFIEFVNIKILKMDMLKNAKKRIFSKV